MLSDHDFQVVMPIALATVMFLCYWFMAHAPGIEQWWMGREADHAGYSWPFFQKMIGFICIGLIPLAATALWLPHSFASIGLGTFEVQKSWIWLTICIPIAFTVPFFSARNPDMQAFYPQVRAMQWSKGLLGLNAFVWVTYLLAYEFLFRGFLLFGLKDLMGVAPALTISCALSVATHIPKGAKETFGTIPFSILLGLAALSTGSLWTPFLIHCTLALSNDWWALYHNPEMRLHSLKGASV